MGHLLSQIKLYSTQYKFTQINKIIPEIYMNKFILESKITINSFKLIKYENYT